MSASIDAENRSRGIQSLIQVLAEADQRGYLTMLSGAPAFQSIGIRLVKRDHGQRFQNHRLITADELFEHELDAPAYMIRTMMQQIEHEIATWKRTGIKA